MIIWRFTRHLIFFNCGTWIAKFVFRRERDLADRREWCCATSSDGETLVRLPWVVGLQEENTRTQWRPKISTRVIRKGLTRAPFFYHPWLTRPPPSCSDLLRPPHLFPLFSTFVPCGPSDICRLHGFTIQISFEGVFIRHIFGVYSACIHNKIVVFG